MRQTVDERNEDLLVYIDGELVHRDEAGVSPFDSVVQGGDAVWEGLRLYDDSIFRLLPHLDRLRDSAKALAFDEIPSTDHLIEELRRTLEANDMRDDVHVRLTLTRGEKITSGMDPRLNTKGPTLIILPEYKTPVYDKSGLSFITSSIRRFPPDCLDPKIHHNNLLQSILAKIEANRAGADAALMLDRDGFIAEGHGTHVFVVDDGTVMTSPARACPEGITRQTVLDLCEHNDIPHSVQPLSTTEAYRADELFCTGTMGELAGITELDGRPIGDGTIGPITQRLSDLYATETATEGYPIFESTRIGTLYSTVARACPPTHGVIITVPRPRRNSRLLDCRFPRFRDFRLPVRGCCRGRARRRARGPARAERPGGPCPSRTAVRLPASLLETDCAARSQPVRPSQWPEWSPAQWPPTGAGSPAAHSPEPRAAAEATPHRIRR